MRHIVFFFILLFFPLTHVVSAVPVLELTSQDNLHLSQCEQGEFLYTFSNPSATAVSTYVFSVTGLESVDYSGLAYVQLMPGEERQVRLTVWPKCGDSTAAGKHSFYLTATSRNEATEQAHASASFTVAEPRSLSAQLVALDGPVSCACQPADYRLELRNDGALPTSGAIVATSPFKG